MTCQITLPIWPTSFNCLSWSKDNLLAVGGGEQIVILTPRLKEPGPNNTHWDSILFKANAFPAEEVPILDPQSFANFSAGEELSFRHVQTLEWSSPGLGRHKGCVLAVLTSNHVLSIWECDGKTNVAPNWKREIVVNHAIRRYYHRTGRIQGDTEQRRGENGQVAQRVRAFAWSPPLRDEQNVEVNPNSNHCYQFLAISTERQDILLLRVSSPAPLPEPQLAKWQIEVVYCFNSGFHSLRKEQDVVLGKTLHKPIVDWLTWGPWRYQRERHYRAPLAFISNGKLSCLEVEADVLGDLPMARPVNDRTPVDFIPGESNLSGPLRFVPNGGLLIAFAADRIFCVETSIDSKGYSTFTSHHLDARWDEITGVAFSETDSTLPRVNVTSHLSSSTAVTSALSLPFDKNEALITPSWQAAISQSKADYSVQLELDDNVQERTWGIAASPMGEYIATAITMLPSDSVAYVTSSDYETIVNITLEAAPNEDNLLPAYGRTARQLDLPSEVLLFSLQRSLERQSEAVSVDVLRQAISKTVNASLEQNDSTADILLQSDDSKMGKIITYLRTQFYTQSDIMTDRFDILAKIALGQHSNEDASSKRVIQRLILEVSKVLNHLEQGGTLSSRIRKLYQILASRLQLDTRPLNGDTDTDGWGEECRICREDIPFESVKWAKCGNGHQFSRCALTFLAIQEPGISKHCSICATQYLNEWKLPQLVGGSSDRKVDIADLPIEVMDAEQPNDYPPEKDVSGQREPVDQNLATGRVPVTSNGEYPTEPSSSLARTLFAAFDVCIYCGGKFTS